MFCSLHVGVGVLSKVSEGARHLISPGESFRDSGMFPAHPTANQQVSSSVSSQQSMDNKIGSHILRCYVRDFGL